MNPAKFDLMGAVGLGCKRKKPQKYAGFNQRMMAVALDSFLILIVVAPFIESFLAPYYPIKLLDAAAINQKLGENPGILQSLAVLLEEASNAGIMARWWANTILQTAVYFIFSAVCWHFWSATPGKMLLRLKVVDVQTEKPITDKQIAWRLFGYLVSSAIFFMGFCIAGFDSKKQGLHDKIAGTVVIVQPFPWRSLMIWKKAKPDSPADSQ
jgi:uncharacterized RDD family membrane protein YckC